MTKNTIFYFINIVTLFLREYKKKLAKNLAGIKEDGAARDIPVSPHQGTMFPDGEND